LVVGFLSTKLLGEIQHAFDVVIVQVTDHEDIDRQRGAVVETASVADLLHAGAQMRFIHIRRSAVDHHEAWLRLCPVMHHQAIALAGTNDVEGEAHGESLLSQMD